MNDYTNLSDIELHKLAKSGNAAAEDELTSRYIYLPRAIARRYKLFIIGADYDDLIQEGTIGLVSGIRSFCADSGAAFTSHLYNCILNRLLSAVKSALRQKHLPLNEGISIEAIADSGDEAVYFQNDLYSNDPEKLLLAQENFHDLEKRMYSKLSASETEVFSYYLEGDTYRSIAEKLGKDTKYVDNAVQRIRKKLTRAIISGEISVN